MGFKLVVLPGLAGDKVEGERDAEALVGCDGNIVEMVGVLDATDTVEVIGATNGVPGENVGTAALEGDLVGRSEGTLLPVVIAGILEGRREGTALLLAIGEAVGVAAGSSTGKIEGAKVSVETGKLLDSGAVGVVKELEGVKLTGGSEGSKVGMAVGSSCTLVLPVG